jgi:hypothetical protein
MTTAEDEAIEGEFIGKFDGVEVEYARADAEFTAQQAACQDQYRADCRARGYQAQSRQSDGLARAMGYQGGNNRGLAMSDHFGLDPRGLRGVM